jgi:outer membrane protein assembly factor BamB
VAVLGGLLVVFGGLIIFGMTNPSAGGTLDEAWISDTPRDNQLNHHAVGVGPDGDVIVAPVAEVPNRDAPIKNTSCALVRLAPENGSTLWRTGMPAEECFTHALTQPAIEDVDGDGTAEVLVSSTENALIAYDARTGTEEWRASLATYGYGRPTLATITSSAEPDVVTSDIRGGVVVARGNGSIAWRFGLNTTGWNRVAVWDAPIVDDINGDGRSEILVGSSRGPVVLTPDGDVEWLRNGSTRYVATAPVDEDAALEVFTAGTSAIRATMAARAPKSGPGRFQTGVSTRLRTPIVTAPRDSTSVGSVVISWRSTPKPGQRSGLRRFRLVTTRSSHPLCSVT